MPRSRPRRWPTRWRTTTTPRARTDVGCFPFKPYCRDCGRDTTTVTAYDDETTDLAYTCAVCDYHGTTNLATQDEGKLVWKADWPMRWAFEHVDFEPAGMDHATPGSSFTVGHELVESVWDYPGPRGSATASSASPASRRCRRPPAARPRPTTRCACSSRGSCAGSTSAASRSRPSTSTSGPRSCACTTSGTRWRGRPPTPRSATSRCSPTSGRVHEAAGRLPAPRVVVPFRMLSSVADVTAGSAEQISRIVGDGASARLCEPRLSRAIAWTEEFVPGRPHHRAQRARRGDRGGARDRSASGCSAPPGSQRSSSWSR